MPGRPKTTLQVIMQNHANSNKFLIYAKYATYRKFLISKDFCVTPPHPSFFKKKHTPRHRLHEKKNPDLRRLGRIPKRPQWDSKVDSSLPFDESPIRHLKVSQQVVCFSCRFLMIFCYKKLVNPNSYTKTSEEKPGFFWGDSIRCYIDCAMDSRQNDRWS